MHAIQRDYPQKNQGHRTCGKCMESCGISMMVSVSVAHIVRSWKKLEKSKVSCPDCIQAVLIVLKTSWLMKNNITIILIGVQHYICLHEIIETTQISTFPQLGSLDLRCATIPIGIMVQAQNQQFPQVHWVYMIPLLFFCTCLSSISRFVFHIFDAI